MDDQTVRKIAQVIFERENHGQNIGDYLIHNPSGYHKLLDYVKEVLSAIDEVGLSVVDLSKYVERRTIKMSSKGARLKSKATAGEETVRTTPVNLTTQEIRRRRT